MGVAKKLLELAVKAAREAEAAPLAVRSVAKAAPAATRSAAKAVPAATRSAAKAVPAATRSAAKAVPAATRSATRVAPSDIMPAAERATNLKRWLGGSKATDDLGEPQRFYHATRKDFSEFKPGGDNPELSGNAIWLSPYADYQPAYHNTGGSGGNFREGARVLPLYARMQNPLMLDDPGMLDWAREVFAGGSREFPQLLPKNWVDDIRSEGYDSIIYKRPPLKDVDGKTYPSDEYMVFEPTQLKSAIGNRGTYDPDDPDIAKARGGLAVKPIWDKKRPKDLGEPESLSVKRKAAAKRRAKAAGRPYPNLVDNLAAARKKGK